MARYLLLNKDRHAVNAIEWDGVTEFTLPEDVTGFVKYDGVYSAGWIWNGQELIDPNPPAVGE